MAFTLAIGAGYLGQVNGSAVASSPMLSQVEIAPEAGLTTSGIYEDPQGAFQIGILEGYSVTTVSGSPLFQAGDGSLAYSVVRVPVGEAPLSELGLAELVQRTLGQGQGFRAQPFDTLASGDIQVGWTGQLSQGSSPPEPVSGIVLATQENTAAYLLVVAALADATDQIPAAVSALVDTLEVL